MIGNDIVDLQVAAAESNWRRPGYLQKIFNPEEQQQIKESQDPDLLVWIFWSMKEAAYKAHQRKFSLGRSFNPSKISCSISLQEETSASGNVSIDQSTYSAKTIFKNSYVHTTAKSSAVTKIFSKIYPSSANIKDFLLKEISVITGLPQSNFSIEKDSNTVPLLKQHNLKTGYAFSISQHGKFAAFTLSLLKG